MMKGRPDASDRDRIDAALAKAEVEHGVYVLLAVESGSRAWGHPSADSDFDVRFLYVGPPARYLRVSGRRDVIEYPMHDDLDVGGWDLDKALRLLVGGNPVILEWLSSPIVYRENPLFRPAIERLADLCPHRRSCPHHYLSLARRQRELIGEDREAVRVKRYFYVIRPALALRWLRAHPTGRVPMALPDLLASVDLDREIRNAIDDLLARKAAGVELERGPREPLLDRLIAEELDRPMAVGPGPAGQEAWDAADTLFREFVGACAEARACG